MGKDDPFAGDARELIRRVYAYVAYRVGDTRDADDVTSETFARAVRYRHAYDSSKGPVETWLIGIARRCIVDHLADSPAEDGTEELATSVPSEDDLESGAIVRLELRTAVAGLPARDRELVALRYGADLTARQIAFALGMTTNAVEVALHRTLKRLRAALDGDVNGEDSSQQGPM